MDVISATNDEIKKIELIELILTDARPAGRCWEECKGFMIASELQVEQNLVQNIHGPDFILLDLIAVIYIDG